MSDVVYRALIAGAADFLVGVVDADLRIRFVSPAIRGVLGRDVGEITGSGALDLIHPGDRALASATLGDLLARRVERATMIVRAAHRDGSWIELEIDAAAKLDEPGIEGILVHARDVTDRIRSSARLERSEARLREIFECVRDGVLIVDAVTRRVVDGNRALCDLVGRDRHELLALAWCDLFVDDESWERAHPREDGARCDLEGAAVRARDGKIRFVDLGTSKLAASDGSAIVVAAIRDVTERRATEELKERFFGVVAHELRSPVAVLRSSVGLLRSRALADADRDALLKMQEEEIDRLGRIVAEGLDFAAAHAGTLTVRPSDMAIDPVLRSLVARLAMQAEREVAVEIEPCDVRIDLVRFEQVVANVLDNAWRHADKVSRVALRVVKDGTFARITIEDDGPGMPADLREIVFERYYLVSDRPTRGMGIGLWLSKRFVEAMRGTIGATAGQSGRGTCIHFTVPLAGDVIAIP